MAFEHYIHAGAKRLRCGYTTGSCAALAAKAAAKMLLGGQAVHSESIVTPGGPRVQVDIADAVMAGDTCSCAVQKDAGDDIDVTDGLLVYAAVQRCAAPGITILGGEGVGRVTEPGLEQPVGEAAINATPRRMIGDEVLAVCKGFGYTGGIQVTVSVPGGEAAAQKTFNPNLGVLGGISILGTTGIVQPRSLAALRDSIGLEMRQKAALGAKHLVLTPGNYGQAFVQSVPALAGLPVVSCANFIGDTLDFAAQYGYTHVLLAGHIGKLVKVAGGVMDTHSRVADCRAELFCAHAAAAGASRQTCRNLLNAATTDACIDIVQEAGLLAPVLESLADAIGAHLARRAAGAYEIGAIIFSNQHGELCRAPGTDELLKEMEAT